MTTTLRALTVFVCAMVVGVAVIAGVRAYAAFPHEAVYQPTPDAVVPYVLELAGVRAGDRVFDLGCGDARIAVAAAERSRGVSAVCVELDPEVMRLARARAAASFASERVELREVDLFTVDLRGASVVVLFLWPDLNARLLPKLLDELPVGARVVSIWHDLPGWKAVTTWSVPALGKLYPLRLWVKA